MDDESKHHKIGTKRPAGVRRTVHPTQREVLLARMLLLVADRAASTDRDQNWLELYNEIKMIAEPVLRACIEGGSHDQAS